MLIDHDTRREHDEHDEHDGPDEHDVRDERDVPSEGESPREHEAQMRFPSLDEPAWLEDEFDEEEMEAASHSPLRGMWIGILAAAVTFVLVFAVPQWLGWYDIPAPPQARRDVTPESVISTVTAQRSGAAVVETARPAAPAAAAPPATAPPASPTPASPPATSPPAKISPPASSAPKSSPPKSSSKIAAARAPKPAASVSKSGDSTFWVQVAAFKHARQAGRFAARVKRDGYPAEVRRLRAAPVPWVVWVGTYPSRAQAESARDALARKGHRGFVR